MMMYNYREISTDSVEFVTVAKLEDVDEGERLFVEIDDHELVVFNIAGEYFAIGDVCSHDDGPLGDGEIEDHEIICPRHGARFDVRSGQVTALPAVTDIPAYPVRISGNDIEIGIPLEEE
ncbi:MAG: non-heme iron oxygenase ferredoxin subunit [Anaerolineales bacterium]